MKIMNISVDESFFVYKVHVVDDGWQGVLSYLKWVDQNQ